MKISKVIKRIQNEQYYYSTLLHELTHWSGHIQDVIEILKIDLDLKLMQWRNLVAIIGNVFMFSSWRQKHQQPNHGR